MPSFWRALPLSLSSFFLCHLHVLQQRALRSLPSRAVSSTSRREIELPEKKNRTLISRGQGARIKFMTPKDTVIIMKERRGKVQAFSLIKGIEICPQLSPATICWKSVMDDSQTLVKPYAHRSQFSNLSWRTARPCYLCYRCFWDKNAWSLRGVNEIEAKTPDGLSTTGWKNSTVTWHPTRTTVEERPVRPRMLTTHPPNPLL